MGMGWVVGEVTQQLIGLTTHCSFLPAFPGLRLTSCPFFLPLRKQVKNWQEGRH